MAEPDYAIQVKHVSKDFILPHDKITTVKGLFTNIYRRRTKTREVQHALKDISLDIRRGEFFGIVGRNGSGKSTLLKILAGIYQPTKGSVHVDGKLVPFIELGVGFNGELTGRENVYLNGAMLGFSKKEMDEMYDDIVAFAELERFMDQKLKNYSSGMQVRLAFSVATRAQAEVLIIDEVLAVGDADFQRKCYEYFKNLKKTNKTVVFVTHDMSAVQEYCDRAVLIENSEIVYQGKAAAVAEEYLKLFVDKQSTYAMREENRWGSGEVIFENIVQDLTEKTFTLAFDMVNKTDREYQGLNVGVDFHTEGQMIAGNGSKYVPGYERGLNLKPKERKHVRMEFANNFGRFDYTAEINIHTAGNAVNLDTIKDAVHIRPLPSLKYAKFFYMIVPLKMTVK